MGSLKDFDALREPGGWRAAQLKAIYYYTHTIQLVLTKDHVFSDRQPWKPVSHENDLLRIASSYAHLAQSSSDNSEAQKYLESFQFLLCMSFFVFIQWKGITDKEIDSIMVTFSDCDEYRRRRLLSKAREINKTIVQISLICEWPFSRATEAFFLCKF
jgi:hypothetical protein